MDSIARPLDRLDESTAWFWQAPELRVLRVKTNGALRLAALHAIAAYEHRPANTRPVLVLEAPNETADSGWALRIEELVDDHAELMKLAEQAGTRVAPMAFAPPTEPPLVRFAAQLAALLDAIKPLEGVVVVLSPVWVESPEVWAAEVRQLVEAPSLSRVRWVLVDLEGDWTASAVVGLPPELVETCDATVDPAEHAKCADDLAKAVASADPAKGAAAMAGGAGPRVAPPPRKNERASSSSDTAALGSVSPKVAQKLRALLAELGIAARASDWVTATTKLRDARDIYDRENEPVLAARLTIDLGTLALTGQARTAFARELYQDALRRADAAGAAAIAVQAEMATAASWQMEGNTPQAVSAYHGAGERAETTGETSLAIHCFCTAGELLSNAGLDVDAAREWNRCLLLSGTTRLPSRAPDAARALAAVMRRHGQAAKANALDQHATMLETLEIAAPKSSTEGAGSKAGGN